MKTTKAINSGIQPPVGIFGMLPVKNEPSKQRKSMVTSAVCQTGRFQRRCINAAYAQVVVSIVIVTANPYASARLSDFLNVKTSRKQKNAMTQLTNGT